MVSARFVGWVVAIFATLIILYSLNIFFPKIFQAAPGIGETLEKLKPKEVSEKPFIPPPDVKNAYNELFEVFSAQRGKTQDNCFVPYRAAPFRTDFGQFSIKITSLEKGIRMEAPPAGGDYIKTVDGVFVDCVVQWSSASINEIKSLRPVTGISTISFAGGTNTELRFGDYLIAPSTGSPNYEYALLDSDLLFYRKMISGVTHLCFIDQNNVPLLLCNPPPGFQSKADCLKRATEELKKNLCSN